MANTKPTRRTRSSSRQARVPVTKGGDRRSHADAPSGLPVARTAGIAAGEVFHRSGSIWPAVVAHGVVNLPTNPVMLLAGIAG